MSAPKKPVPVRDERPLEKMTEAELLAELDRVILRLAKAHAAVAK
jgi:hypothetical protein